VTSDLLELATPTETLCQLIDLIQANLHTHVDVQALFVRTQEPRVAEWLVVMYRSIDYTALMDGVEPWKKKLILDDQEDKRKVEQYFSSMRR
jgi:hypothetical protein